MPASEQTRIPRAEFFSHPGQVSLNPLHSKHRSIPVIVRIPISLLFVFYIPHASVLQHCLTRSSARLFQSGHSATLTIHKKSTPAKQLSLLWITAEEPTQEPVLTANPDMRGKSVNGKQ